MEEKVNWKARGRSAPRRARRQIVCDARAPKPSDHLSVARRNRRLRRVFRGGNPRHSRTAAANTQFRILTAYLRRIVAGGLPDGQSSITPTCSIVEVVAPMPGAIRGAYHGPSPPSLLRRGRRGAELHARRAAPAHRPAAAQHPDPRASRKSSARRCSFATSDASSSRRPATSCSAAPAPSSAAARGGEDRDAQRRGRPDDRPRRSRLHRLVDVHRAPAGVPSTLPRIRIPHSRAGAARDDVARAALRPRRALARRRHPSQARRGAPDGVAIEPWYPAPLVAALPRDHPLAQRAGIRIADLRFQPLITYPRDAGIGLYWPVLRLFTEAGAARTSCARRASRRS